MKVVGEEIRLVRKSGERKWTIREGGGGRITEQ